MIVAATVQNDIYQIDFTGTNKTKIDELERAVDDFDMVEQAVASCPDEWLPVRLNWCTTGALCSALEQAAGVDGEPLTTDNDSVLDDLVNWLARLSMPRFESVRKLSINLPLPEGGYHVTQDPAGNFRGVLDDQVQQLFIRTRVPSMPQDIVKFAFEHDLARSGVIVDMGVILAWGFDWCTTMLVLDALATTRASGEVMDKLRELQTRMILWSSERRERFNELCEHDHGLFEVGSFPEDKGSR